jgi:hypothetical protein
MRRAALGLAVAAALAPLLAATPARAEDAAPLTFELDKERTVRQKILIASFGGGALLVGGVGLLFHLDSRDKSDSISASGRHTGMVYSEAIDDTRRAALRSRALTIASYGVAAGLLVTTLVLYVVTDPGTETITLDEAQARLPVTLEPVAGGALGGLAWGF